MLPGNKIFNNLYSVFGGGKQVITKIMGLRVSTLRVFAYVGIHPFVTKAEAYCS